MQIDHIGIDQKVLVICVKFSDISTTRVVSAEKWVNLLNEQVRNFYNQSTFGKTTFTFETVSGGPSDGWFQLPYRSDRPEGFFVWHSQDAISLADPHVDFSNYNRVLIIDNARSNFGHGSPQWALYTVTRGGEMRMMENGRWVQKRVMTSCLSHEGAEGTARTFDLAANIAVHELGHNLWCKEHYGNITILGTQRDSIIPWSVMGRPRGGSAPTHQLGWSKYERGWLVNDRVNRNRIQTITPPFNNVITLKPQEILYPSGVQLILIPFRRGSPFQGYVIENRARLNGDEAIPQRGVVISMIDENNPRPHGRAIVVTNPRFPTNMDEVPFRENDSFRDESRNITIRVMRQRSDDFDVRIQYPMPINRRPNPIITPWGSPPWETIDIWFDSQRNGWGPPYRYQDPAGNPLGNGDAPWLNHQNRIYVRITNRGPGDASNVRVNLYSSQPPAIGNPSNTWDYIGNIIFPLIGSGTDEFDFILWTPTRTTHTCIKAEIEASPDYVDQSLKVAQENIAIFETTSMSPWRPVNVEAKVHNPYSKPMTVYLNIADVPKDWAIQLDSLQLDLPSEGSTDINLKIFPGGPPNNNEEISDKYKPGFIAKPKIEAWVPYEDTLVLLGGIEAWVHLVNQSALKLDEVTVKDQSVIVKGSVEPHEEGLIIAVEIRQGETKNIVHTTTDKEGNFVTELKPPSNGIFLVQCFFDGNDLLSASESKEYEIQV